MSVEFVIVVASLACYVGFAVGVLLMGALWRRREARERRVGVVDFSSAAARGELDLDWEFGHKPAGSTRAPLVYQEDGFSGGISVQPPTSLGGLK